MVREKRRKKARSYLKKVSYARLPQTSVEKRKENTLGMKAPSVIMAGGSGDGQWLILRLMKGVIT